LCYDFTGLIAWFFSKDEDENLTTRWEDPSLGKQRNLERGVDRKGNEDKSSSRNPSPTTHLHTQGAYQLRRGEKKKGIMTKRQDKLDLNRNK
jgi:hypothetical protein